VESSRFLKALRGENDGRPPIWMMRQAGRALASYRALRAQHPLRHLFHTPELIDQITTLPIDELGVDAAILFSDILIPLEALGMELNYVDGQAPTTTWDRPHPLNLDKVAYVTEGIKRLKSHLPVPLIGFAGGPYTVATYVDKEPSESLIDQITDMTIAYLDRQIDAGVDALQIFDSWAGRLSQEDFATKAAPYLKRVVDALKGRGVPIILFCRETPRHLKTLADLNPTAISTDWSADIRAVRDQLPNHIALQGNLNPDTLFESFDKIDEAVDHLLMAMKRDRGYIFNLGHGVLPKTPESALRHLVERVKSYDEVQGIYRQSAARHGQ